MSPNTIQDIIFFLRPRGNILGIGHFKTEQLCPIYYFYPLHLAMFPFTQLPFPKKLSWAGKFFFQRGHGKCWSPCPIPFRGGSWKRLQGNSERILFSFGFNRPHLFFNFQPIFFFSLLILPNTIRDIILFPSKGKKRINSNYSKLPKRRKIRTKGSKGEWHFVSKGKIGRKVAHNITRVSERPQKRRMEPNKEEHTFLSQRILKNSQRKRVNKDKTVQKVKNEGNAKHIFTLQMKTSIISIFFIAAGRVFRALLMGWDPSGAPKESPQRGCRWVAAASVAGLWLIAGQPASAPRERNPLITSDKYTSRNCILAVCVCCWMCLVLHNNSQSSRSPNDMSQK